MAQKKETDKKEVEVKDLAPKKDAKGGAARSADGGTSADRGGRNVDGGSRNMNAGGQNLDRGSSLS